MRSLDDLTAEYVRSILEYNPGTGERAPFDPAKVHAVLTGDLPGVIRAKGHFWLATRPNWVAEYSLAGAVSSVTPLGGWWVSVPRDRWPTHPDMLAEVASKWAEPWGDRRQELVFIGAGMDESAIRARLDAALIQAQDFTPDAWTGLPDPFPQWGKRQAA
jgi:G3E family GTPase